MKKDRIALILNIAAAVIGLAGVGLRLSRSADDFFLYYTQLSNVVALISSILYIMFRDTGNERLGRFVRAVRYLGACGLATTFVVVMCIFIPVSGSVKSLLDTPHGVLQHAVCPVISVASYVFFEKGLKARRAVLIPIGATAVYAFTIYTLNFLRLAPAPYPFFDVYNNSIAGLVLWFLGLLLLIGALSVAVFACNRRFGGVDKGT